MLYRNIPTAMLATGGTVSAGNWLKGGKENSVQEAQAQQPNWQGQQVPAPGGQQQPAQASSNGPMGAGRGTNNNALADALKQLQGGNGKRGGMGNPWGKGGSNWADSLRGMQQQTKEEKLRALMSRPENAGLFPPGEQYEQQNKHTAERMLADEERRKADERKEKFRQDKNPMHATIKQQQSRVEREYFHRFKELRQEIETKKNDLKDAAQKELSIEEETPQTDANGQLVYDENHKVKTTKTGKVFPPAPKVLEKVFETIDHHMRHEEDEKVYRQIDRILHMEERRAEIFANPRHHDRLAPWAWNLLGQDSEDSNEMTKEKIAHYKTILDSSLPHMLNNQPEEFEHLTDELFAIIKQEDQHHRHLHNLDQSPSYARANEMIDEVMTNHTDLYRQKEEEWVVNENKKKEEYLKKQDQRKNDLVSKVAKSKDGSNAKGKGNGMFGGMFGNMFGGANNDDHHHEVVHEEDAEFFHEKSQHEKETEIVAMCLNELDEQYIMSHKEEYAHDLFEPVKIESDSGKDNTRDGLGGHAFQGDFSGYSNTSKAKAEIVAHPESPHANGTEVQDEASKRFVIQYEVKPKTGNALKRAIKMIMRRENAKREREHEDMMNEMDKERVLNDPTHAEALAKFTTKFSDIDVDAMKGELRNASSYSYNGLLKEYGLTEQEAKDMDSLVGKLKDKELRQKSPQAIEHAQEDTIWKILDKEDEEKAKKHGGYMGHRHDQFGNFGSSYRSTHHHAKGDGHGLFGNNLFGGRGNGSDSDSDGLGGLGDMFGGGKNGFGDLFGGKGKGGNGLGDLFNHSDHTEV